MTEHQHTDTSTNLIINRLKRSVYNDLLSDNMVYSDQLYLIDDDDFDVFNKRIVNALDPEQGSDAVTLGYLSSYYIEKANIRDYIDNSRIYSENLSEKWANGARFICGDKKTYVKDTGSWEISVLQGRDVVTESDVTVVWTSGMGWQFSINGHTFGQNFSEFPDTLRDSTTYSGKTVEVSATSWHYDSDLVSKKEIYACLSCIGESSGAEDIKQAIIKLNAKLSA